MKLKLDRTADALYLTLDDAPAAESEEVAPGVILDFNAEGMVVGIEMLYLSKRQKGLDLNQLSLETVGAAVAAS